MVAQGVAVTQVPVVALSPVAGDQTMVLPTGTPARQRMEAPQAAMVGGSAVMLAPALRNRRLVMK